MKPSRPAIAVLGGNRATPEVAALAEAVGREIARAGVVLVCGGRGGVMEAACRGARAAGGTTVGILPGERGEANPYLDIVIPTGMGLMRNVLVVRAAHAAIAIDGEYGTLSEIAMALTLRIPVVGLVTWSVAAHGQAADPGILRAGGPAEAVALALQAAGLG